MPSGAKKRKTAKKKQVQQTLSNNPNSSAQSHDQTIESDSVQLYGDKESDGGSPASQDYSNTEPPFAEDDQKEVEKRREGSSSDQSIVSKKNSLEVGLSSGEHAENVATVEDIVQIEWELKSEEDYESKEGSIESKEVCSGGSSENSSSRSSSSHSSSDDESRSHGDKKTEVVETGHAVDSVEPFDSLSKVANPLDTSISAGENSNTVTETASNGTPAKKSLLIGDIIQVHESTGDFPVTSSVDYKVEVHENADNILPDPDNNTRALPVGSGLMKEEDKGVPTADEKTAAHVDVKDYATKGKDDNLLLSFNAPNVDANNDAGFNDSKSHECSESQRLVASAPQAVQRTSWKSCCGIVELFTSSDR